MRARKPLWCLQGRSQGVQLHVSSCHEYDYHSCGELCICSCIEVEEVSGKGMRVLLASFMLVVAMNMTVLGPYSCS